MPALSTAAASYTHAGRRHANQDAVVVRRLGTGAELVAVADGMGGHSAGEVASAMALEVLIAELETGTPLGAAVAAANRTLFERSRERADWQGMGTTLVVLLRTGDSYRIANVGDSRAYVVDAAAVHQLTDDHSFVAEALRSGSITAAEAERSPWRNALTRALGTDAAVDVDVFGPFPTGQPHAVVLCSDGLHKAVPAELIREYVLSTADLPTAAEALAALAFRRGSDDNISIAIVEFDGLARRPPSVTLPLPIRLQHDGARRAGGPPAGPAAAVAAAAPSTPARPPSVAARPAALRARDTPPTGEPASAGRRRGVALALLGLAVLLVVVAMLLL